MKVRAARPEDAKGIAKVLVDARKEVNRGLVPDSYLDSLTYQDREERWSARLSSGPENDITLVATDNDQRIFGFAHAGPSTDAEASFDSELYEIYIDKSARRANVGLNLLIATARELTNRGFTSLEVWVLAGNPHRNFYEKMGGERLPDSIRDIGGATCPMARYVWRDLRMLCDKKVEKNNKVERANDE